MSFRKFGETIGNDWGRDVIGKDLWLDIARARIELLHENEAIYQPVVFDDMRYPNEFWMIRELGGLNIFVHRPKENGGRDSAWQSEGRLNDFPFDCTICNDGSVEDIRDEVDLFMERFSGVKVTPADVEADSQDTPDIGELPVVGGPPVTT